MDRQQAYDFLLALFPRKEISLETRLTGNGGSDEPKESFRVYVHGVCKCVNGGIAAANGYTWEEAIYNTFKDLFEHGEKDSCIVKMGELADSINEHTEKLKRMDEHEYLPTDKRNTG